MNATPLDLLNPVFRFMDKLIVEDGVYLYPGLVWLSAALMAWIFSGGLRGKIRHQPQTRMGIGIVIQPPASPPPAPSQQAASPTASPLAPPEAASKPPSPKSASVQAATLPICKPGGGGPVPCIIKKAPGQSSVL